MIKVGSLSENRKKKKSPKLMNGKKNEFKRQN